MPPHVIRFLDQDARDHSHMPLVDEQAGPLLAGAPKRASPDLVGGTYGTNRHHEPRGRPAGAARARMALETMDALTCLACPKEAEDGDAEEAAPGCGLEQRQEELEEYEALPTNEMEAFGDDVEDATRWVEDVMKIRGPARRRLCCAKRVVEKLCSLLDADMKSTTEQAKAALKFCGVPPPSSQDLPADLEVLLQQLAEFLRVFKQYWGEVNRDISSYQQLFSGGIAAPKALERSPGGRKAHPEVLWANDQPACERRWLRQRGSEMTVAFVAGRNLDTTSPEVLATVRRVQAVDVLLLRPLVDMHRGACRWAQRYWRSDANSWDPQRALLLASNCDIVASSPGKMAESAGVPCSAAAYTVEARVEKDGVFTTLVLAMGGRPERAEQVEPRVGPAARLLAARAARLPRGALGNTLVFPKFESSMLVRVAMCSMDVQEAPTLVILLAMAPGSSTVAARAGSRRPPRRAAMFCCCWDPPRPEATEADGAAKGAELDTTAADAAIEGGAEFRKQGSGTIRVLRTPADQAGFLKELATGKRLLHLRGFSEGYQQLEQQNAEVAAEQKQQAIDAMIAFNPDYFVVDGEVFGSGFQYYAKACLETTKTFMVPASLIWLASAADGRTRRAESWADQGFAVTVWLLPEDQISARLDRTFGASASAALRPLDATARGGLKLFEDSASAPSWFRSLQMTLKAELQDVERRSSAQYFQKSSFEAAARSGTAMDLVRGAQGAFDSTAGLQGVMCIGGGESRPRCNFHERRERDPRKRGGDPHVQARGGGAHGAAAERRHFLLRGGHGRLDAPDLHWHGALVPALRGRDQSTHGKRGRGRRGRSCRRGGGERLRGVRSSRQQLRAARCHLEERQHPRSHHAELAEGGRR
ncbi:unnamed protein product [Prorocentrum cordatum]|uniref:Uncharacterized protein n=1 Tax=Prorocentrum cordatum TaxID=2364126 RepID=A0ABN9QCI8_9DINO|nr:unnamed protein product [Polarella glacialis]